MITQTFILGLTFIKRIISPAEVPTRVPVTFLLYRDGVMTYVAVVGMSFHL